MTDTAALCRDLAVRLTERPSVTGTPDEASFGPWLAALLSGMPEFGPEAEVWTFPVAPGDARLCVAMLVRGSGDATVLLTGHYDTVTTVDYADLMPVATQPDLLAVALAARLADAGILSREGRARGDLASGRYLPGRGLLDMKAGLAAGLAAMAAFAAEPRRRGNLLFLAVPDEENASAGARRGAADLAATAAVRGLTVRAAINLDAIADDGDGSAGRVVALGSVGKVLPTAFVVGAPVHSGFPLRGLNAAVLAGAIAARLEWAPEMTDGPEGTPVSLLSLKDGKAGYDVTTPATAFATWSVLNRTRHPGSVLTAMEPLVREALVQVTDALRSRAGGATAPVAEVAIPILRYRELFEIARAAVPEVEQEVDRMTATLREAGTSHPDLAQALTALVWQRAGLSGPAVVLGLGSTPYLAVSLDDARVARAVADLVEDAPRRHGVRLATADYFAGISDMSFFGQGDASDFVDLAADTPGWGPLVGLDAGSVAQVPCVNLGPWGRDYHTPLERIETDYGFRVLPALIADLCGRLLAD